MRLLYWPPVILIISVITSFVAHQKMSAGRRPPLAIHTLRWLLGLIFVLAGLSKLLPGFPNLIGPPWLEERLAPFGLALFARFIAVSEALVGVLLFTRRFATLGALMLVPMLVNILVVTISLHWRGTPFVIAVLLAFDGVLLVYDYPKLRLLVEDRSQLPASPGSAGGELRRDGIWLLGLGGVVGLALVPLIRRSGWSGLGLSLALFVLIFADWRRAQETRGLGADAVGD